MNDVLSQLPFSESDVDFQNFTASILHLSSVGGVISYKKLAEIRLGLDKAFVETAEQYTKRESSTISIKRAELLYSSVLYQADVYLLSLNSIEKAIDKLENMTTETILENGKKRILILHEKSKQVFKQAYKNRLALPVYEYRYVMEKAFDEYCNGYSARFDARNCCASIDYPLLGCAAYSMKSQGAMFIFEYYTSIMLENEFCKIIGEEKIEQFLSSYGMIYNCKYTDMLFNIAEVLINSLLAGALVERPLFELYLSSTDIANIESRYCLCTQEAFCNEVKKAFSAYREELSPQLYQYIRKYIPIFACDLFQRIQNGGIDKFLVVEY